MTPELEAKIAQHLPPDKYKVKDPSRFWTYLVPLLPWVILIFLFWFILLK